ncbi:hypothetical protein ACFL3B_01940 [Gemmatimonadota bacterium]
MRITTALSEERNGALKIGELPVLHMVALDDVVLHEDPDAERVGRLLDRIVSDGVLRHPPVVGRLDGHRRIVLDGANRVTALRKLDCRHALVQEIDLFDPDLVLDSWHHAIEHLTPEALLAHARSVPEVILEEGDQPADNGLASLVRFRFIDGIWEARSASDNLTARVRQLRDLTRVHHGLENFDRVSYTDMAQLQRHYRHFTALMSFPLFTREDLVELTGREQRLPSGITRVLIPKRALRFNLQLQVLQASISVEEKEARLQQTIQQKVADKSIRFYREPTFCFDE